MLKGSGSGIGCNSSGSAAGCSGGDGGAPERAGERVKRLLALKRVRFSDDVDRFINFDRFL